MAETTLNSSENVSVDPSEVAKFSAIASEWWDPKGKFRPLHKFNPTRLQYLRQKIVEHFDLDRKAIQPLKNIRLLDVGCGGGLVCEPMARLGANVTGLDASEENIKTASVHADEMGLSIDYRAGTIEALIQEDEDPFDVVLSLEVVEHVANPNEFLADCAKMVKPGGLMISATLNKTAKSKLMAIYGAEYVLRWLPPGTHDWNKFVPPEDMQIAIEGAGLKVNSIDGLSYNPIGDSWSITKDLDVNYFMVSESPQNPECSQS